MGKGSQLEEIHSPPSSLNKNLKGVGASVKAEAHKELKLKRETRRGIWNLAEFFWLLRFNLLHLKELRN